MDLIQKTIEKQNPSFEELIDCLEKVKENKNVAVVKFDGERERDWYTILILFPNGGREMIREDGSDLKSALIKVLSRYIGK
jgi:hypothetical protein